MSYFVWNGISSEKFGILKQEPYPASNCMNFEYVSIKDRNFALKTNSRNTIKISMELQIKDTSVYDYIYAWLNNGNSQGELILSKDLKKYYKATCSISTPSYISKRFSSVTISFTCIPFRYSVDNSYIELTSGATSTIEVSGNYYSEPKIIVYGNGNGIITVNGKTVSLYVNEYLTLDSERLLAYKDNTVYLNQMIGNFPKFQVGENTISFDGSITSLKIFKNERWL